MMDVKRFDWDKYVRSASYYAVLDGTDYSHKIPTMFSPDKKQRKTPAQPPLPVQ
jgi:hypothetical protein